ncbi:MAG: hypothetical protein QOI35_2436 [Cryptosporangiaceae bacterium]|nr:hypothetical protein [Cryptosporangiaceae bacterium]
MLDQRCSEIEDAVAAEDAAAIQRAIIPAWEAARDRDAAELTAAVARLAPLTARVPPGVGGRLAVLCGAMTEGGADPQPLAGPVAAGLLTVLGLAAGFPVAWRHTTRRIPFPLPADNRVDFANALRQLGRSDPRTGVPNPYELTESWFCAPDWAMAATTLLATPILRAAFPLRDELLTAARSLAPLMAGGLDCLVQSLGTLDGEPLRVISRPAREVYEVTVGGVALNRELLLLLRTTGLAGRRDRAVLAAPSGGRLTGEGLAADLPVLAGRRTVTLARPPLGWARRPDLRRAGSLTITMGRTLPAAEAAEWLQR